MACVPPSLCSVSPKNLGPPSASGRSIAVVRTVFGVSALDLAAAAGMSPYSLSRLERSHRSPVSGEVTTLLTFIGRLAEQGQSLLPTGSV